MNILAIGAGGFMGAFIARELAELGHRVTVMDFKPVPADAENSSVRRLQGDVTKVENVRSAMEESRPEVVISLAGLLTSLCAKEPYKATQVNIMGVATVLEQARLIGARRVINASSAGVCSPDRVDTREDCHISPKVSMYGATKFIGEVLGREFRRNYNLEVVNLRYSLVYGAGEVATPGNAMRLKKIESAASGKDVLIDDARETDRVHLVHVSDAAHATVLATIAPGALKPVYNISGVPADFLSFGEIVAILRRINPKTGRITFTGQGTPIRYGMYLSDLAREDLSYIPRYTAESGLRENVRRLSDVL